MDQIKSARKLQKLLITQDAIVKQIQDIDNKVETISRRLFVSDLTSDDLDNSLFYMHHSSVMGVKHMLENCRLHINQQVTKISRQIIASLQADDTTSILEQMELESPASSTLTDIAAIQYTTNAMMQFRCN